MSIACVLSSLLLFGFARSDVKPANTLFGQEGQIKFVDFGASKIYKSQKTVVVNGEANTLVGTPHYIAPEVITGETVVKHGAQDIWSLGCCILEMVTGRKPWSSLDNEWAVVSLEFYLQQILCFGLRSS